MVRRIHHRKHVSEGHKNDLRLLRLVETGAIVLTVGKYSHEFGDTLSIKERKWLLSEINAFIRGNSKRC
ncbi:MAG: hypothetical protein AAFW75_18360 [Cyanobacteria bacterium J06636_16]